MSLDRKMPSRSFQSPSSTQIFNSGTVPSRLSQAYAPGMTPLVIPGIWPPTSSSIQITTRSNGLDAGVKNTGVRKSGDSDTQEDSAIDPNVLKCGCPRCAGQYLQKEQGHRPNKDFKDNLRAKASTLSKKRSVTLQRAGSVRHETSNHKSTDEPIDPYRVLKLDPSCSGLELKERYLHLKNKIGPQKPGQLVYLGKAYKAILAQRREEAMDQYDELLDLKDAEIMGEKVRVVRFGSDVESKAGRSSNRRESDFKAAGQQRDKKDENITKTRSSIRVEESTKSHVNASRVEPSLETSRHVSTAHMEEVTRAMEDMAGALSDGLESAVPWLGENVTLTVTATIRRPLVERQGKAEEGTS